ncbi:MAG: hypothetical protein HY014_16300 [Acidobacteria bacterium]|nr:hypothetical protein [Acidobacteriota bacterium]MBI3489692.1 hypothetical protein [Acidobacteriota bacterium]
MRALLAAAAAALGLTSLAAHAVHAATPGAPRLLSQTGLYASPGRVDARHLAYAPQYPLWTDGAAKSRWLHLPAGATAASIASIDGRDEDAWVFPVGTKAWKEFRFQGRKVETRLLWKTGPSSWIFASYAWNEAQTDAVLVPESGAAEAAEVAPGRGHSIPSRTDCRTCHGEGRQTELLGFNALQLSPDRDPGALHGEPWRPGMTGLGDLVARGLLRGARRDLLTRPPRIQAEQPTTRSALGYLAANCASCHRGDRPLPGLDLDFRHTSRIAREADEPGLRTTLGRPSLFQPPGLSSSLRLAPGQPDRSALLQRMASRRPASQMPPLGSALVDEAAVTHLRQWIAALPMTPSH